MLSQLVLLKCSVGQGRAAASTSMIERLGAYSPWDTRTSQRRQMKERRFHYFCSSENLLFSLVMKHVFSIVNIIRTINWKANWIGDFIFPVNDSQRLGGGREDFIISWAWAHGVLLMLKRLMQSLQSTCTWKYWVGVERWHSLHLALVLCY